MPKEKIKLSKKIEEILEHCPLGVSVANLEGDIIFVNSVLTKQFKIKRKNFLSKNVKDFYVDENERESVRLEFLETGVLKNKSVHLKRGDGTKFYASLNFKKTVFGNDDTYFCWFYDLSDVVYRERIIDESGKQLYANLKREALIDIKSEVAHHVNNPITVISGYLESLRTDVSNGKIDQSFLISRINAIQDSTTLIAEFIKKLSKDDEVASHRELLDINVILNDVIEAKRFLWQNQSVRIISDLTSKQLDVCVAKDKIVQVFNNILNNAKEFNAVDGNMEIFVQSACTDDQIVILFKDNGKGFDVETVVKSLNLNNSHGMKKDFTRNGFSYCKKVIEGFDGELNINSRIGSGTEVRVILPYKDSSAKEGLLLSSSNDSYLSTYERNKILVVEDDIMIAKYLEKILTNVGVECDFAVDGLEALKLLEKQKYDIVISDIKMPIMDGVTLFREVAKSNKISFKPPFLFCTAGANIDFESLRAYENMILIDVLYKPFKAYDIYEKLKVVQK